MLDNALDRLVEGLFIAAPGGMHDALNIPRVCVFGGFADLRMKFTAVSSLLWFTSHIMSRNLDSTEQIMDAKRVSVVSDL